MKNGKGEEREDGINGIWVRETEGRWDERNMAEGGRGKMGQMEKF